tara:strand:- start:481 stop:900 length:420 start_codon:yes stop_codon:yes gene_type:complete
LDLNEVAPPSKKHERMVKHIKKSYKKDGKLSKDEESIAYATAWKDFNKEEVSRRHKPSAVAKKKKLEKLLIDKEVKDIQKESSFQQFMADVKAAKDRQKKQIEDRKKKDAAYVDRKKHGVKFYDKKGSGRIVKGRKVYS